MSKIRGVFPLFLATTFGIVNGIWVFGPAFKEQQEQKELEARKAVEVPLTQNVEVAELHEETTGRILASEGTLKPAKTSSSWWPNANFWSKELPAHTDDTQQGMAAEGKQNDRETR